MIPPQRRVALRTHANEVIRYTGEVLLLMTAAAE
jgi:hypothetical protein